MFRILSIVSIFIISFNVFGNEIALTFDDAPRGSENLYTGDQRTKKIIKVLGRYNLKVAFFSNSKGLKRANGQKRMEAYSRAGHFIGNHTHSHPSIDKVLVKEYLKDFDLGHNLLSTFPTFQKWFRFPYLREGNTIEKRDAVRSHLKSMGYINGYVTVDNYDYFINQLVQEAIENGKEVDLSAACEMLNDILWDGIDFYDKLAKKYIGHVRHILLMHENDIEAECLAGLIQMLYTKRWTIVSPDKAFSDPLLKSEPNTLYLNQGRVAAIVHEKTGQKFISKWESSTALTEEFNRRKIVK